MGVEGGWRGTIFQMIPVRDTPLVKNTRINGFERFTRKFAWWPHRLIISSIRYIPAIPLRPRAHVFASRSWYTRRRPLAQYISGLNICFVSCRVRAHAYAAHILCIDKHLNVRKTAPRHLFTCSVSPLRTWICFIVYFVATPFSASKFI